MARVDYTCRAVIVVVRRARAKWVPCPRRPNDSCPNPIDPCAMPCVLANRSRLAIALVPRDDDDDALVEITVP